MALSIKHALKEWIGEGYLMASALFYWIMAGPFFNPVSLVLLFVIMMVVVLRNPVLGCVVSLLFILANLYLILAMLDELNDFPSFNRRAIELLIGGSVIMGLNIFVSVRMFIKWGRKLTV